MSLFKSTAVFQKVSEVTSRLKLLRLVVLRSRHPDCFFKALSRDGLVLIVLIQ